MQGQGIENFMSRVLVVVDPQQSLGDASRLMRGHAIRHLPVVHKGEVVGILSQRDVYLVETLSNASPGEIRVEEAMTHEPFLVDPEESVHSVASRMAARKIGSAVVARDGKLLGLFTVTDALRALAVFARAHPQGIEIPVVEDDA
jgi:acetoin utilization protein AcuB